jgi:hypothetical protein
MTQLTIKRYVECQKELLLILSEMSSLLGDEDNAMLTKQAGRFATGFTKFELNIDYDENYPEDFTPWFGNKAEVEA